MFCSFQQAVTGGVRCKKVFLEIEQNLEKEHLCDCSFCETDIIIKLSYGKNKYYDGL